MEWGDKEDFLWEIYAKRDIEPEALAKKPALSEFLVVYIEAFSLLSAQREIAMDGVNPVPLSEMLMYASEYEIEDRDTFIKHMCVMDRAFRQFHQKRSKSGAK